MTGSHMKKEEIRGKEESRNGKGKRHKFVYI